jgi:Papain family cysteine protease
MSASEFIIVVAIVIVGLIFLVVGQRFIFGSQEQAMQSSNQAEAEGIISLINRIVNEPASHVSYSQYISLTNITIKDGILTYEREGDKYSFQLPKNVSNVYLEETTSVCVIKTDGKIMVSEECPKCNLDTFCSIDECKENCPDCVGPNKICIGDGFCNLNIGENCENSPKDCTCESGKICCPKSPDSDVNGCSLTETLKKKGEQCWCDNQCDSGLKCNPTAKIFKGYSKACCEAGKSWNGTDCIVPECKYPCEPGCIVPDKFDWRDYQGKNWLNPIRDQAKCGSCWIFSAVGATEGTYNVEQNSPAANKDLSEQYLISCGSGAGCMGGFSFLALKDIKNSGVCDDDCFPYQDLTTGISRKTSISCSAKCGDWGSRMWKINNYASVSSNENIKRALICHGPLSVESDNWGHSIVLVGYDDAKQEWIIRNSWGVINGWIANPPTDPPVYYENGYGRIPYTGHKYSDIVNDVHYAEGVISP